MTRNWHVTLKRKELNIFSKYYRSFKQFFLAKKFGKSLVQQTNEQIRVSVFVTVQWDQVCQKYTYCTLMYRMELVDWSAVTNQISLTNNKVVLEEQFYQV